MPGSAGEKKWSQAPVITGPSRPTTTIRLRDIYNPKPPSPKAPVRIRPPSPRPASLSERGQQQTPSDNPSVQRKRAQSLSLASGKKREPRRVQPGAILEFAICYRVNGWDFWDNNDGNNYKLACHSYKVTVPRECEDSMLHFT
ncbi:PREDICTED: uncharacterized protein LOC106925034 isoform X2 [Poecilia mexicana]|uniref:uncharacterized protein LOC106925034 isoform X2 n=1 Tax=Poecilia mexicana TaxID=48701 RepID=UPI00072E7E9C|nr:PREDICTED: uncharacterized protein LOC106925034 isoform X2 [Poecilia mexicana]